MGDRCPAGSGRSRIDPAQGGSQARTRRVYRSVTAAVNSAPRPTLRGRVRRHARRQGPRTLWLSARRGSTGTSSASSDRSAPAAPVRRRGRLLEQVHRAEPAPGSLSKVSGLSSSPSRSRGPSWLVAIRGASGAVGTRQRPSRPECAAPAALAALGVEPQRTRQQAAADQGAHGPAVWSGPCGRTPGADGATRRLVAHTGGNGNHICTPASSAPQQPLSAAPGAGDRAVRARRPGLT